MAADPSGGTSGSGTAYRLQKWRHQEAAAVTQKPARCLSATAEHTHLMMLFTKELYPGLIHVSVNGRGQDAGKWPGISFWLEQKCTLLIVGFQTQHLADVRLHQSSSSAFRDLVYDYRADSVNCLIWMIWEYSVWCIIKKCKCVTLGVPTF